MDSTVQWFNNAALMTRLNSFICVMFWVRSLDGCMGRNANNNGSLLQRACDYEIDPIQLIRPSNQMHKGLPQARDQQSYMAIQGSFSACVRGCCLVCSYTRLWKRKYYAPTRGVFCIFSPESKRYVDDGWPGIDTQWLDECIDARLKNLNRFWENLAYEVSVVFVQTNTADI